MAKPDGERVGRCTYSGYVVKTCSCGKQHCVEVAHGDGPCQIKTAVLPDPTDTPHGQEDDNPIPGMDY